MYKFLVALACFSTISIPLFGTQETVGLVLTSKETCVIGELVRLDASQSDVDGLVWKVIPETPNFEVIEGGRRALFSAEEAGDFLFILAGAKGGTPYLQHVTITVEDVAAPTSLEFKIKGFYNLVKSPTKKDEALKVAGVFRTLSSTDIDVDKILDATAVANRGALGASLDAWLPFLEGLGKELDAYELTTKEQYKEAWAKIAEGLEKCAAETPSS